MKVAVASSDGIMVNQHFGHATQFFLYDQEGKLLEVRAVKPFEGGETPWEEEHILPLIDIIADCDAVLASRIGQGAAEELRQRGVMPFETPGYIAEGIKALKGL